MLTNQLFQNTKKLLNGAIPIGGNKAIGAKMTNGLGNSTGVAGNKISAAYDLTKGMGNSIGVAGKNNIVGFERKPEIKKTGASGDGRHFTPAELVKTYEQKQVEQANNLKQKQENLNTRSSFTTENNKSQTNTQQTKRQEYSGIQSIVAKPVIQKQVQPQYIPIPNNNAKSQPIQTVVQSPLGVGQNQIFNNQTKSLTKNITAAQVGTGGQKSYGVGAGNVNNDPSYSVGQNVNSLVNDNTSSRFTAGNIQNAQPLNQPAPLVNSATQTEFNGYTTHTPNPTSQIQSVQPQNIVQVGQQSQYSATQVSPNDPLNRDYIPRTQNQTNSPSPVAFFDSTQTSSPIVNTTTEVIPVGQQSQYSKNEISQNDPLNNGFLAQSKSSTTSPIEDIQKEKVYGVGESQATQNAKNISDNSNKFVVEDLSAEPVPNEVISGASPILTKDQIIDRILRETVITIASNCRNVTENYLVDIGFEFPKDIENKIASLNLRAKIGREKGFSSSLIRKDPAGKWYELVDIGALGDSSGGFREILLDLGKSQPKDELFSKQPKPGVYLTKADYGDPKYKEKLDNHNYAVSVQRGEKYGSTATKEKYELYKKIAKETKFSKQTKSEFKSKEPIELFLEMPKLGETERIPKTLRIVVDDEGGVQYLVQIDTSNPNPDYFKYSVNLGSRIYNEKHDKLFLSLVAPADVTGQREEFWKFEKIRTIRILEEESKIKGASSNSAESETLKNFKEVGSKVNITPNNNKDVIKVGQSTTKSKVIGLNGALGLTAIGAAAATNSVLNGEATSYGQTNNNSENKTSTVDYQSSSTSSKGSNSSQSRQSSSQSIPVGSQGRSAQRQTNGSSNTNQYNQNQSSANQPLGSAARPPNVIPVDPNLQSTRSNQVNNSIPVGQQSSSTQPQNIGVNQYNQSGQNQNFGKLAATLGSAARPPSVIPVDPKLSSNIRNQVNNSIPVGQQSSSTQPQNIGVNQYNQSGQNQNFGKLAATLGSINASQPNLSNASLGLSNLSISSSSGSNKLPVNSFGQPSQSFSPTESLNKLKNSSLNTSTQFVNKNLPNSGVISTPYQLATSISSGSINNPQNPGQVIQFGGINKDRPLIDAKGNPIPIRNNNSGSLRTGLSATLTTTDTILGVATAGILPANSIGRANSPISTNNSYSSNSISNNSEYTSLNPQDQSRSNNLELNSDGGNNGNQPPNNRPPKPTGGNDDENDDDQNPEDQNDDIDNNEIDDDINSSAIVPYEEDDVVDGEFVDEDDQPLNSNENSPSQKLLSGKQTQELLEGVPDRKRISGLTNDELLNEYEQVIDYKNLQDQIKNPNSQNPFGPNTPEQQKVINEAKRKNFFDKLVGRARSRIPGYKDPNVQKVKSETTQSNKNPLSSKQNLDTAPIKRNVGDFAKKQATKAAKDFVKKAAFQAFLANAWWILPTILALLLMLAFVGGIIAIECDNGKSDVRTFKTVDTIITGVEALSKTASGDVVGGIGKALQAGIGTAEALVVYDSGLIRSDLNRFISKLPGCASPCQTQGVNVANVNNASNASAECFNKQLIGKSDKDKVTLWKAQGGVTKSTDMTVATAKEILGFVGKDPTITVEVAAWVISLATTESSGGNWEQKGGVDNACYGIIQFCTTERGSNTYQSFTKNALGSTPEIASFIKDKLAQMKTAAYAFKEKLRIWKNDVRFKGRSDVFIASAGWLGVPKGCDNTFKNSYINSEGKPAKCWDGATYTGDYGESGDRNFKIITCSEATQPAQALLTPNKFNQPIQLAKLQFAKDNLSKSLSDLVGFPVQYKSPEENLKRPEMNSYGIQVLDDRINEFNQIMGGRVIVEAAETGAETEAEIRNRVAGYFEKGEFYQVKPYSTDDYNNIKTSKYDLNIVKFMDTVYKSGLSMVTGPKSSGRTGKTQHTSNSTALDVWGLGYLSDIQGKEKIKGFKISGRPGYNWAGGLPDTPANNGNTPDTRIKRHVDIPSDPVAMQLFSKLYDIGFASDVSNQMITIPELRDRLKNEGKEKISTSPNGDKIKVQIDQEISSTFWKPPIGAHFHHFHFATTAYSVKQYKGGDISVGAGSGSSNECCPDSSAPIPISPATPELIGPIAPVEGEVDSDSGDAPADEPKQTSFLNFFQPVKASAVTVADVVEAGKKRGYAEELTISESDVVAVDGTTGGNANPRLLKEAAAKWKEMDTAAKAKGITIGVYSGFRSVGEQTGIIERKIRAGETVEKILSTSAPPGYSQHQTGRGVDINDIETRFGSTPAYTWLTENAVKYGFSNTYPKGNKAGADWEPWHWFYFKGYPGYDQTTGVRTSGPKEAGATAGGGTSSGSSGATGSCCPGQSGGSGSPTSAEGVLSKNIEEIVKKYGGHSAVAQQVSDGKVEHYNGNQPPDNVASTIKSVVTVVVIEEQLKKLASSGVNVETEIKMFDEIRGGEDDVYDNPLGQTVSIKTAIEYMLTYSSNATTNALVYYFGGGDQTKFQDDNKPKEKFTELFKEYGFSTMRASRYLNINDGRGTAGEQATPGLQRNSGTALDITKSMYKVFQDESKYSIAANALRNAKDLAKYKIKETAESVGAKNIANKWGGTVGTTPLVSPAVTANIGVFEINSKKYVLGVYVNGNYTLETNKEKLRNINKDIIKLIKENKLFGVTPTPTVPTSFLNFFQPIKAFAVESPDQILLTKVDPVANTTLSNEEKAFLDMVAVKEQGKYNGSTTAGNRGKYQIKESDLTEALKGLKGAGYDATGITTATMLEPKNQDMVAIGRILWRSQPPNKRNEKRKLGEILKNGDGFLIALGMASEEFQALPAITGFNSAVVTNPRADNGFTIEVAKLYYQKMLGIYGGTSADSASGLNGIDCNKTGVSGSSGQNVTELFKSGEFSSQSGDDESLFQQGKYDPKVSELIVKLYAAGFKLQGGSDNYRPEKKGTSKHKTGEAYDFAAIGKKGGTMYNIKQINLNPTTGPHAALVKEFTDAVKNSGLLNGNQLIGPNAWKSAGLVPMGTNDVVDKETGAVIGTHEDHIHVGIN
jgi:zinc D-Ala-D-Ala carboxypeptidase